MLQSFRVNWRANNFLTPAVWLSLNRYGWPRDSNSAMNGSQAKAAVAPNQDWALLGLKFVQYAHQAGARFACAVLFARGDNNVEHQAQVAHPVGVQRVTGPARLVGVVADLSAFLLAVQRLDGGVDVQNPRGVQCGLHACQELGHKPGFTLLGAHPGQGAP